MKKVIILTVALVCLSLFSQCTKNTSCRCREYDASDHYYFGSKTMDPESFGATNCSDLETKLRIQAVQAGYDEIFECTKE